MALPQPTLQARTSAGLSFLTDEPLFQATGLRIAFTGRAGGVSEGPYASLNLGGHVEDDAAAVAENVARAARAVGACAEEVLTANQVHGTNLVEVHMEGADERARARAAAAAGADGFVVTAPRTAALLCFADCTPVVIASPTGSFAVAHAGWRGCVGGIAGKAARELARADGVSAAELNAYIGPHIGPCCFEVGPEVVEQFRDAFGPGCVEPDGRHVSMARAVAVDLAAAGVDPSRICEAAVCTQCHPDLYFSYRASGGVCGRHGAIAYRGA